MHGADAWLRAVAEPDPERRLKLLQQLIRQTSDGELPGLMTAIARLDDAQLRFELRRAVLYRLARVDGLGALALTHTLTDDERVVDLVGEVLSGWAGADPASALDWFARSREVGASDATIAALAHGLGNHSAENLIKILAGLPAPAARDSLIVALVDLWIESQPRSAARLLATMSDDRLLRDVLGRLVPQWSRADLSAALEWARALPSGEVRSAALIHIGYAWAQDNPAQAAEFAHNLPPGQEQLAAIVINQWARRDWAAAADWTRTLPEGEFKEHAAVALAATIAQSDPQAAAEFSLRLPPGNGRDSAIISIVSAWATHEPAAAAEWVERFPAGRQRQYAIENVIYSWMDSDAVTAVNWLQRLPGGLDRDTALHAGAGRLVETHPDLAAQLALGIADEGLRHQQAERAARAWLAQDRAAASAWIQQSSLPSGVKQRLTAAPGS